MKLISRLLAVAALLLTALSCAGCVGGCGAGYSEGDRIGTVTKLSRKGLIIASWEGEMYLGGLRRGAQGEAAANVWAFHASDAMAPKVQDAMNQDRKVRLHYRQWAVRPIGQDSDYDVTAIEVLP